MFAVGQESQGVFALGQSATGVIAVGQLARGVIVVGQGAVGIVAVGQGALGVLYAVAMLGVGARGFGGVLQLVPKPKNEPTIEPPPETPLDALRLAGEGSGWVKVTLRRAGAVPEVISSDGPLEVAQDTSLAARLRGLLGSHRERAAFVQVSASREVEAAAPGYRDAPPVRTELRVTDTHGWQPREWSPLRALGVGPAGLFLRSVGLAALTAAWWYLAGADVVAMFGR